MGNKTMGLSTLEGLVTRSYWEQRCKVREALAKLASLTYFICPALFDSFDKATRPVGYPFRNTAFIE